MKAFALLAPVLASSPVSKVIQLIDELKVKVQKDLQNEAKAMKEYSTFCDDEQTAKGFAIRTAAREIDGFNAVIEDTTGRIQKLAGAIDAAGSEQASKSEELRAATDVRQNEHDDFVAAEKELVEAVDTLSRAITIIKREMSFVQGSGKAVNASVAKKLSALSTALGTVIEASWLDSRSRATLKNFLSTESDDELSLKQPQAAVHVYENHSGGIVETLEDMKDKAETALNNLRREETKSRHAFELLKQSLSDAVKVLGQEIDEASSNKSGAEEKLAKAQGDLATTQDAKAADEAYVAKLTAECENKAAEWGARQASAKDEITALTKGHEILSNKFGFVQTSVKKSLMRDDSFELRDRLTTLLKKLGRKYNSFGLMQLANSSSKDPFVKVRGLIEGMIAKLLKQSDEEATHDAFCKEETKKSTTSRDSKQANADKYQARIDEAKATIAELKNEVAELQGELADISKSNQTATQLRAQEKANFKVASTDYKESAEAITQALVVLKDFYRGGASLVQQPEFGSSRGDAGHSIIEILEVAGSDFSRLLAEAETAESEADAAYKALIQENKVSAAKKNASIKAKVSENKSLEVALTHHSEDFDTVSKELDAVLDYIQKLKPQCESRAMTYEERKARRDAEIAGLKEALSILEGEDVGAFIQKKGFLSQK